MKSARISNLARALVAAQAKLKNPPTDSDNPHYRSRYVSLAGLRDAIAPTFARHGLAIVQSTGTGERGPTVTTLLLHVSGEWLESEALEMPASRNDAQGWASCITYARRYQLAALADVADGDDDDAEAAVRKPAQAPGAPPAARERPMSLGQRIIAYEDKLIAEGLIAARPVRGDGELMAHLKAKFSTSTPGRCPPDWTAAEWEKQLEAECRAFADAERQARKAS